MRIRIEPGKAAGKVSAPPSKSMAHRMLICAAMSDGVSTVRGISDCEDVAATLDCMSALGVQYTVDGDCVTVNGIDMRKAVPQGPLYARESGSTLRFLIPVAMLADKDIVFHGAPSLLSRPFSVYECLAKQKKLGFVQNEEGITVKGPLCGGEYRIAGNISSQFISGLLFALPVLPDDSNIRITTAVESRSYINLTLKALSLFGVKADWVDEHTIFIPGRQRYCPCDVCVEGDYSGAAFIDALNLFSSSVLIDGLDEQSLQGDSIYKKYFPMLNSGVPTLHIGDCPDLGPILFAVAAAKNGGVFSGTHRLKIKESDRAEAMAKELRKFGTSVTVYDDAVVVYPAEFHSPNEMLYGHNDHRIVMALSVLLTLTGGEIDGAEAIKKSYPAFFSDLKKLGIRITEIN